MSAEMAGPPWPFPPARAIEGRHVRLEPIEDETRFGELFAAFAGPDFAPAFDYMAFGPFADGEAFAGQARPVLLSPAARFFAIVDAASGRAQGMFALMRVDQANGVVEVGNVVLGPRLARTRAATEAFHLLFAFVFETLGYRRLEWKCDSRNAASRRAAARLGFSFEGVFRQHMIIKGRNRDTAWFAMLDGEWPARANAMAQWLADENFDAQGRQKQPLATPGRG